VTPPREDGGGRVDGAPSTPPPSAGVRLAVAILDADEAAPEPTTTDGRAQRTVLVVAAEADLRRYVRECLRDRTDVRVLEAATVAAAAAVAAHGSPQLLIVDEPEGEILAVLSRLRAIVIVDDMPRRAPPEARLRLLARPFAAEGLLAEVGRLLG
jgi:hypothetical protein